MAPKRRASSAAEERHVEWLALLRPDGPFLSPSVLAEVFPQGPAAVGTEAVSDLRQGWEELADQPDLLAHAWIDYVLTELLRYRGGTLVRDAAVPAELRGGAGRTPDAVAYGPDPDAGRAPRMLIYRVPWGDAIEDLTEQAKQRARKTGVPLALITDGRLWRIVHAQPGEVAASHATFDADLWLEERVLLHAFVTLLDSSRVLAPPLTADGAHGDSLAALFGRTAEARDKLTTDLGNQVRQAVELLVGELARLDREAGGALLAQVSEREIYRGTLTVMMRLVFCLYAEERRLLPVDTELYVGSYAVSGLYSELAAHRSAHGGEVGDRRSSAWARLMATFAAIHGGCEHDLMRIRPYGGSLFDPARTAWMTGAAVTDRVVFEVLNALLRLRRQGRAAEPISYKGLDVEQIGHIYEGLLEFACIKAAAPHVGLGGKAEPELPLADLEAQAAKGANALINWVAERTRQSTKRVAADLKITPQTIKDEGDLHAACDSDPALTERVRPFYGLLRRDLRGHPVVFPARSVMFTQTGDRRETGTHYTPPELADEVVRHTLDPLCHDPGPAQGADRDDWRVRPAAELLDLKVADPACGSAAFLVAACRYLGEHVVEAWRRDGLPRDVEAAVGPDHTEEDLRLEARRRVAARCLHGVDRDDMAIELAKLSLWLVTLSRDKPFSFLDHALRVGDSLVGLITAEQVAAFHFDPAEGHRVTSMLGNSLAAETDRVIAEVTDLRAEIEDHPSDTITDIDRKQALLDRAELLTHRLRFAGDAVVGAALSTAIKPEPTPWDPDPLVEQLAGRLSGISLPVGEVIAAPETYIRPELKIYADEYDWHPLADDDAEHRERDETLEDRVRGWLTGGRPEPVRPLHWALEFPEVMRRGGFHAVVSNPPFSGGQRLTGNLGKDTREYWIAHIARGKRGSADMSAYFLLRDLSLAGYGRVGIIATNTIAQGDTREVGLDQVVAAGRTVFRAVKSQPWPNKANVHVSLVWAGHAGERERPVLDHHDVPGITPSLDARSRVSGNPKQLTANEDQAFQGSIVLGKGFVLEIEQAQALIEKDPRNKDALFPYLNGDDLNNQPDCSASRWVINFHDWSERTAATYPDCFEIVKRDVLPRRLENNRKV